MIISVSRRTDIPAFYCKWFMERVEAGWCDVQNPFNHKQVSRVSLEAQDVEAFVFWSKDFRPLLPVLPVLADMGYDFVFLYTITGYGELIEPGVPPWETAVETFKALAREYGANRIAWRYDPVILSTSYSAPWHRDNFRHLAEVLAGSTSRVILSLVDDYRKAKGGFKRLASQGEVLSPSLGELADTISGIAEAAGEMGMTVQACAEEYDLSRWGVKPGACIDAGWLGEALNRDFAANKDKGQRQLCRCAPAKDIGVYGTCQHGCTYCYAGHIYNK